MQTYLLSALDDGERVVTERLDGVRSVTIGFWIGAGSRDEDDSRAGVSHLLEHMLFKGTRSYSALDIAEIFDGIGGELNAATTREYTMVYARIMDEHVETALDVMTDMVFAPTLADLDSEREVVLEEIAMYEDTPQDLIHDLITQSIFGHHPLGRPVIGSGKVISRLTRRSVGAYHRSRYVGDNLVVAAAGTSTTIGSSTFASGWPRRRRRHPARKPRARPPLVAPPAASIAFQHKDTEQYHVCIGAPAIARSDRRRFTASILDSILGGSASSRLFQEIREKRGLAYSVYTFAALYADTGELGVYVGTREENLATCLEIVATEIEDIAGGGVGEAELHRAKENLKGTNHALDGVHVEPCDTAWQVGDHEDSELLSLDRILAEIEAVNIEGVGQLRGIPPCRGPALVAGIGPSEARFREAVEHVNPALLDRAAA